MPTEVERQVVHVPPETAHVATVRAFVGAIGRHVGCGDEAIEDLRLAATEACAQALEEGVAPNGIELRTWVDDGRLVLEIEPCGSFEVAADGADAVSGRGTRRMLIEGLFPDAAFELREGRNVLRISAPTSSS